MAYWIVANGADELPSPVALFPEDETYHAGPVSYTHLRAHET